MSVFLQKNGTATSFQFLSNREFAPGHANVTTAENGASTEFNGGSWRVFIFVLALLIVPSLFFVTGQSVWIDEANSA